jgi:CRP/FNR family transcriptional regulator, cyclic AMP receptor protein
LVVFNLEHLDGLVSGSYDADAGPFFELLVRQNPRMAAKPKRGLSPKAFLEQTGPGRRIRVYRNKEVVYATGSPADAVFYLRSGMIKLTVTSKRRRKKAVLAILQEGDFFGEGSLGKEPRRTSTVTSIGTSTIARVEKGIFRRKLDRDPAFAAMFTSYLLSQIARFKADLADHFLNFSERRLARVLLMQGVLAQKSKSGPSTLRFSQATLAEMIGTTRPRVSRFMNDFREKGYIRYNGGVEINSERLTAYLQD